MRMVPLGVLCTACVSVCGDPGQQRYIRSSGQDGGIGRNPSLPHTTKRRINNQSKINKQTELPENQTAWNSDNQGIKRKNQPEQPDQQLRSTAKRVTLPG